MKDEIKLTKLAKCAGCGAKVGAGTLARLLASAARQTGRQEALLCGGVASSALLRELLAKRLAGGVRLYFGQSALSGDNAVGAALLAADEAGGDAP